MICVKICSPGGQGPNGQHGHETCRGGKQGLHQLLASHSGESQETGSEQENESKSCGHTGDKSALPVQVSLRKQETPSFVGE